MKDSVLTKIEITQGLIVSVYKEFSWLFSQGISRHLTKFDYLVKYFQGQSIMFDHPISN